MSVVGGVGGIGNGGGDVCGGGVCGGDSGGGGDRRTHNCIHLALQHPSILLAATLLVHRNAVTPVAP